MIPTKIRVKILSEAAGYISVTQVSQREFSGKELIESMVPIIGRDAERICKLFRAGTISTGDYRLRWEPLEVEEPDVHSVLASLPRPEPSLAFQPDKVLVVRFRQDYESLDLSRESASRKPLFARNSFWNELLGFFAGGIRYSDYSDADKADVFVVDLDAEKLKMLESLLPLLPQKSFAERLGRLKPQRIEWLIRR